MSISTSLKNASKLSIACLFVLFTGSIIFYKERILFLDEAFILFEIINSKSLGIQLERYGNFISRIGPLLCVKTQLPLQIVVLVYSVSFTLFYLIVGIVLHRLREYAFVILLAFFYTLYISDAYFWTNNEIYQGIAWLFLNFGILNFFYKKFHNNLKVFITLSLPIFILFSFISIYTHPLVMVVFIFLWVFFMLSKQAFYNSIFSIPYIAVIILISIVKYTTSKKNGYDSDIMQKITDADVTKISSAFKSGMADDFWHTGLTNYWILWLLFLAACTTLFLKKKYTLLGYIIFSCVGYFVMICLAFQATSYRFHMESEWAPLSILGTIAFVYYLLPAIKPKVALIVLCLIFLIRLTYISFSIPKFSHRINVLENVLANIEQKSITKAVLSNEHDIVERNLIMGWALPCETILLSKLNGDSINRTVAYMTRERINELNPEANNTDFIDPFFKTSINNLNKDYFNMDTTKPYTMMDLNEVLK